MPDSQSVEILITVPFRDDLIRKLQEISPLVHITSYPAKRFEDIPLEIWADTQILYTDQIVPDFSKTPALKWIQFNCAGVDFLLEEKLSESSDLIITTLSGASSAQMAEYALTMMLALGHRLKDWIAAQERMEWSENQSEKFQPAELRQSTVGIIGYGSVGRELARLLQPFDVTILAVKRDVMQPQDFGYTPRGLGDPEGDLFQRLYPIQAVRSMVRECDFVVITLPLSSETKNVINESVIKAMKPTASLVDVSRGGVVDQKALYKALKEKQIASAALDVFSQEPLPADDPLWKLPNLILTPHMAGASSVYLDRAVILFSENLSRYLSGMPLYNRFDSQKGY